MSINCGTPTKGQTDIVVLVIVEKNHRYHFG